MAVRRHPRLGRTGRDGVAGGLVGRLHCPSREGQDSGVAPGSEPLVLLGDAHP